MNAKAKAYELAAHAIRKELGEISEEGFGAQFGLEVLTELERIATALEHAAAATEASTREARPT